MELKTVEIQKLDTNIRLKEETVGRAEDISYSANEELRNKARRVPGCDVLN